MEWFQALDPCEGGIVKWIFFPLDFQDMPDEYSWVFVLRSQSVQLSILGITKDFSCQMAVHTQLQSRCSSNGMNILNMIVAYDMRKFP